MLSSGTALVQIVAMLASPLLTRLYTPEDFGVYSVYVSIATIIQVIVCLRFDVPITLADKNEKARNLLILCVLSAFIISIITGVITVFFHQKIGQFVGLKENTELLVFISVSVFLGGVYSAGTYWRIRENKYKVITQSKITQSLPQTFSQLYFGYMMYGVVGLILGELIGRLLGSLNLWKGKLIRLLIINPYEESIHLKSTAIEYKKFPLISSWSALINSGSLVLPALFIAWQYGLIAAGAYSLVQRVFAIPVNLIGQAMATVYMGTASKLKHDNIKQLGVLYTKTMVTLFFIGIIPVVIIGIYGVEIFTWVFGKKWQLAGQVSQVLAVLFLFRFAMSPVSQTLMILEKQYIQLIWDVSRIISVVAVFGISITDNYPVFDMLIGYSIVIVGFNFLHVFLTYIQLTKKERA